MPTLAQLSSAPPRDSAMSSVKDCSVGCALVSPTVSSSSTRFRPVFCSRLFFYLFPVSPTVFGSFTRSLFVLCSRLYFLLCPGSPTIFSSSPRSHRAHVSPTVFSSSSSSCHVICSRSFFWLYPRVPSSLQLFTEAIFHYVILSLAVILAVPHVTFRAHISSAIFSSSMRSSVLSWPELFF